MNKSKDLSKEDRNKHMIQEYFTISIVNINLFGMLVLKKINVWENIEG